MRQRYNDDTGAVTMWLNGLELRTMEANDLAVYYTPGSFQVYVARGPQFRDDTLIATPSDFLAELELDSGDGLDDETIAELTVQVR